MDDWSLKCEHNNSYPPSLSLPSHLPNSPSSIFLFSYSNFTDNAAAQVIYFFKCGYFIFSALQMVAGYPTRILGYFVGKNYSIVFGAAFFMWVEQRGEGEEDKGGG